MPWLHSSVLEKDEVCTIQRKKIYEWMVVYRDKEGGVLSKVWEYFADHKLKKVEFALCKAELAFHSSPTIMYEYLNHKHPGVLLIEWVGYVLLTLVSQYLSWKNPNLIFRPYHPALLGGYPVWHSQKNNNKACAYVLLWYGGQSQEVHITCLMTHLHR